MAGKEVAIGELENKKILEEKEFRPIILAKDGCKSAAHLLSELTLIMSQPGMRELIGIVKLNEALCQLVWLLINNLGSTKPSSSFST